MTTELRQPLQRNTELTETQDNADQDSLGSETARHRFLRPLIPYRMGKAILHALVVTTFPVNKTFRCSNKITVAANTDMVIIQATFGHRCTSYEVWNYDTVNSIAIWIETTERTTDKINIGPNSYYTSDMDLGPESQLHVDNSANGAGVSVQGKLNGW